MNSAISNMKIGQDFELKRLLNLPILLVLIVIVFALGVVLYSEAQRSRIALQRLFDAIEPALAKSLIRSDYLELNVTARALVASQADSIKIYAIDPANHSRLLWSYPNLLKQRDFCAIRFHADIRFQGLVVGKIENCFEPMPIVRRTLLSTSSIIFFLILSGVILASGAIGNLRLKRKMIAFSAELEEWGLKAVSDASIPDLALGVSDVERRLGKHTKNLIEALVSSRSRAREHEAIASTTQNLAHDARKPFSMLKMVLEALSDAEDPVTSREIAKSSLPEVNQAMASLEGMIQDVMQIGSNSKPNQEVASPEAVIDAAVNELFRIFPEADVAINYELKHEHVLFVDTMRVGRVFSNILVNAVQAMKNKGTLWIKTLEENGYIEFRLGNAGSCIPKEHLPKLFEAFFTAGKKGGTGLGLAIAQKVVHEHGGRIRCESDRTQQYPEGQG